jgi:hypothetical protein
MDGYKKKQKPHIDLEQDVPFDSEDSDDMNYENVQPQRRSYENWENPDMVEENQYEDITEKRRKHPKGQSGQIPENASSNNGESITDELARQLQQRRNRLENE